MQANLGQFDPALLFLSETDTGDPDRWVEPAKLVMINRIIGLVAERMHVPMTRLKSRIRTQHVAFVRQVAMYLLRHCTDLTYPEIGAAFDRDHSTAIHGHDLIDARIIADSAFAALIERLKGECQ